MEQSDGREKHLGSQPVRRGRGRPPGSGKRKAEELAGRVFKQRVNRLIQPPVRYRDDYVDPFSDVPRASTSKPVLLQELWNVAHRVSDGARQEYSTQNHCHDSANEPEYIDVNSFVQQEFSEGSAAEEIKFSNDSPYQNGASNHDSSTYTVESLDSVAGHEFADDHTKKQLYAHSSEDNKKPQREKSFPESECRFAALAPPNQPVKYRYPPRKFGETMRCFQARWYERFPWLNYNQNEDSVTCHICCTAIRLKVVELKREAESLISRGFCNWRHALEKFDKHSYSVFHKQCEQKLLELTNHNGWPSHSPQSHIAYDTPEVGLAGCLETALYLATRGVFESESYERLIQIRSRDKPILATWSQYLEKWDSSQSYLYILNALSEHVLKQISDVLHKHDYFSILLEDTGDGQTCVSLRSVDSELNIRQDFIGFCAADDGSALKTALFEKMEALEISICSCRGYTYDCKGKALNIFQDLENDFLKHETRTFYVPSTFHSFILLVQDAFQTIVPVRNFLHSLFNLQNVFSNCPTKTKEKYNGLAKTICFNPPTHNVGSKSKTIPYELVRLILKNYDVCLELLQELSGFDVGSVGSNAYGLYYTLKEASFYMLLKIYDQMLAPVETLQIALNEDLSVKGSRNVAHMVMKRFKRLREESQNEDLENNPFQILWEEMLQKSKDYNLEQISNSKIMKEMESNSPQDEFRKIYQKCTEIIIKQLENRFNSKSYDILIAVENVLTTAVLGNVDEEALKIVLDHYGDDLQEFRLNPQLHLLQDVFSKAEGISPTSVKTLIKHLKSIGDGASLFREVWQLCKLYLTAPFDAAKQSNLSPTSELIKQYLKAKPVHERDSKTALIFVNSKLTETMNFKVVAEEMFNNLVSSL